MKVAELFVNCLENEGVEYIFGVPGEENVDILDALLESPIRFITTQYEQGAAFMADVYGGLISCAARRANPYRVERAVELAAVLKRTLADDVVSIIDCPVDYSENMKPTRKLKTLLSPI